MTASASGYTPVEPGYSNPAITSVHRLPRHSVDPQTQSHQTVHKHSQYGPTPDLMNDLHQHKSSLSKGKHWSYL